jgi:hypothetical protein
MATVNLGRIKPVFRGAYNNSTAYVVDDIVTSGNETFIAIAATQGNATSDASKWTKLAAKGADGTDVAATLANKEISFKTNAGALDGIPIGTAGQFLKVNSGATGYEFDNAGGGQVSFVSRTAITSNVASVAFTNLEANNYHKFVFQSIDSTDNGGEDWSSRYSTDNGSSYITSSYRYSLFQFYDSGSTNNTNSGGSGNTADKLKMADGFHTSGPDEGLHGEYTLYNVGNGQRPFYMSQTTHKADSTNRLRGTVSAGFLESGVTINAVQFFFDSGNITGSSYAFITHYKGVLS